MKPSIQSENQTISELRTQAALSDILKGLADHDKTFEDFLQSALEVILDLPWLKFIAKGSIFITNADGNLEMLAQQGLGDYLLTNCKLLKPGQCLCGKALQKKELLFTNHVTHDHDIQPPGMTEHGHYNAPLIYKGNVLGVLNLYVVHGHIKQESELTFLNNVSIILASAIYKFQVDDLAKKQAEEQKQFYSQLLEKTNEIEIQRLEMLNKNEELLQQNEEIRTINEQLEESQRKIRTQASLAHILKGVTDTDLSIEEFMQKALESILELPWLKFIAKGSVFITNAEGNIEMVAQMGLSDYLLTHCKVLKPGQCLCGKALQKKQTLFCNHVTPDHDIQPPGMSEHGHYNAPLMYENEVLGVLNLYVTHGHIKQNYELEFLDSVSSVLASAIKKDALNKLAKKQSNEQRIISEKLFAKNLEIEVQKQEMFNKNEELLQQNEEIRTINEQLEESQLKIRTQASLALILKGVTETNLTIEEFLQKALESILDLPWLKFIAKGSVFLTNPQGNIEMVAQMGLSDYLLTNCKILKPGQCLCGKALQKKQTLFCNHVTPDHDIQPPGMSEHGHYNAPLMYENEVLGVLNLYVTHGHIKQNYELEFLDSVSSVLASAIKKDALDKLAKKQAEEQKILNEELFERNTKIEEQKLEMLNKNEELLQQNEEIRTINENLEESQRRIRTQASLAQILKGVTDPDSSIDNFLQQALNAILDLPWLKFQSKGSIFITNEEGNLDMVAEKGLGEYLLKECKVLKPGQCLCGQALLKRETLFCNHITPEHDIRPPGMKEHGHYNAPLIFDEEILGVLNIYVNHDHIKQDFEIEFINSVSIVLASQIKKYKLEKYSQLQAERQIILNKELEETNREISDSINYAKRIQKGLFPSKEVTKELLKEHFILHRSKETVGGDFYYVVQIENNLYFAVADCTGHGVAGAFLAILGVSYLNGILKRDKLTKTNEILELLRREIKGIFRQFGNESNNGMDIALCCINLETNFLEFCGAYNPLFLIRENELIEYKGTKSPIGTHKAEKEFVTNTFELKNNDCLYIFSDGYYDQFGGKSGQEKFLKRRFKELLIEINQQPMNTQKKILYDNFNAWKGEQKQIDDLTVMGIRWTFKI